MACASIMAASRISEQKTLHTHLDAVHAFTRVCKGCKPFRGKQAQEIHGARQEKAHEAYPGIAQTWKFAMNMQISHFETVSKPFPLVSFILQVAV